jgi:hypothetical protein
MLAQRHPGMMSSYYARDSQLSERMERQMPLPQLPAYTELNKLKTHEIITRIEENIAAHNTSGGLDLKPFYNAQILFDEIARRQGNRQTLAIIVMTIIILAATLLSTYYTVRAFEVTRDAYRYELHQPSH